MTCAGKLVFAVFSARVVALGPSPPDLKELHEVWWVYRGRWEAGLPGEFRSTKSQKVEHGRAVCGSHVALPCDSEQL